MEQLQEQQLDAMTSQLQRVLETKDVQSYLESNINYELDPDLDEQSQAENALPPGFLGDTVADSIFSRFFNWWRNSRLVKKIKKAICTAVNKIKELIDEEAELKKILQVALAAVLAALGITINPIVATIIIGLVATMILEGVTAVCPV